MKKRDKIVIVVGVVAILASGFWIDRQRCLRGEQPVVKREPVVKQSEPLCVTNVTGSKVKAAMYTNRMRRYGKVINLPIGKSKVKRNKQSSYLAVARKEKTLGKAIDKSVPHIKTRRAKGVSVSDHGYDLDLTYSKKR
jgi:hypothetical protein